MKPPRVKICGITRLDDASLAVELGASAIGFVLWPQSPRVVTPPVARRIAESVPPFVTRVGVFVDQSPDEIAAMISEIRLDAVQIHGNVSIDAYRGLPARLVRAVALEHDDALRSVESLPAQITVLVDAADAVRWGGTGRHADWQRAATLARRRPTILAGGLTAENVGAAIDAVHPWAVDVSSGVESAPGIKDADRMRRFFDAVQHRSHTKTVIG